MVMKVTPSSWQAALCFSMDYHASNTVPMHADSSQHKLQSFALLYQSVDSGRFCRNFASSSASGTLELRKRLTGLLASRPYISLSCLSEAREAPKRCGKLMIYRCVR